MRLAGYTALYTWQKWEVHVKCQKTWINTSLEDLGEIGVRMLTCGLKLWDGFV
jgi:hypothetical protein